jgi:hypothetical protein
MRRFINRTFPHAALGGAMVLVASCSGGDKIVDPNAVSSSSGGNNTSYKWNAGDSSYIANVLIGSAGSAIKGMRNIKTPDLPSYGKNAPPCTPSSTVGRTDTNNNGIPDDQTLTYLTGDCKYTVNGAAATVVGSMQIQDLGEIFSYRATYRDLVLTITKGDSVVTTSVSGSLELHWTSANAASYIDKSTIVISSRSSVGSQALTRAANLTAQFTPASGSTISSTLAFPAGTMSFTGTLGISAATSGNGTPANVPASLPYSIAVTNPVTLAVTASCTAEPVFSAGGALNGQVTGITSGTVSVRFVGCGGVGSKA